MIAAGYPGTALAFTEWNYAGGNHISGTLAVADVLGIFGRDDVGMASYWNLNGSEPFAYAAFRAYRNFEGAGHDQRRGPERVADTMPAHSITVIVPKP